MMRRVVSAAASRVAEAAAATREVQCSQMAGPLLLRASSLHGSALSAAKAPAAPAAKKKKGACFVPAITFVSSSKGSSRPHATVLHRERGEVVGGG